MKTPITLVLLPSFGFAQEDTEANPGILPDSPFYGLKMLGEKLQLMFTFNEKAKIRVKMRHAERRLVEAEQMTLRNKTQIVERLMARYQEHVEEAEQHRERLRLRNITIDDVDEWMNRTTSKHIAVLQRVMQNAPEQAQSGLQNALQNAEANKEKIRDRLTERIRRREGTTTTTLETTTTTLPTTTTTVETGNGQNQVTVGQGVGIVGQGG
jgi:hypothetical protein